MSLALPGYHFDNYLHFKNFINSIETKKVAALGKVQPFKRQPHKMVKLTQTICRLFVSNSPTDC